MEVISVTLVIIHCGLLAMAFLDNVGATCALDRKYPICFFVAMYIQVFFYILTYTYKCCNYWMSESLVAEDQKIVIDDVEQLIETGNSNNIPEISSGQNDKKKKRRVFSDYEIHRAQMWRW